MNPNKTIVLRLKPITEITEEEMKEELLTTNGVNWMQGSVRFLQNPIYGITGFACIDSRTNILGDVKLYAILPKDK